MLSNGCVSGFQWVQIDRLQCNALPFNIVFNSNTALQSGGIQIERFHAMVEVWSGARASTVQNTDQGDSRMKKMINNENISSYCENVLFFFQRR